MIASGSHIDSQTPGGRYDGALGVIAALVAVRTLGEQLGRPRRTIEAVSLCEEEASRFHAANFWGSRTLAGAIGAEEPERIRDADGVSIAEAMRRAGLDPAGIPGSGEERHRDVDRAAHRAGPRPRGAGSARGSRRRDHGDPPLRRGALGPVRPCRCASHGRPPRSDGRLRRDGECRHRRRARAGRPGGDDGRARPRRAEPARCGPERVTFTIDSRHPDPSALAEQHDRQEELLRSIAARRGLEISWTTPIDLPPCVCDPGVVAVLERPPDAGRSVRPMHSGAGHDTQNIAGDREGGDGVRPQRGRTQPHAGRVHHRRRRGRRHGRPRRRPARARSA